MQLRYKKFRYDTKTDEVLELGDEVWIYKTEYIGNIKHLPENILGESFDYMIVAKYSDNLFDFLNKTISEVFKVRDNMIIVLTGAYIDESEYKVFPISEIPDSLVKGCYILDIPSSRALKYLPEEERFKILDTIAYTSISKVIGFCKIGVLANHITLYNWLTFEPQLKINLNEEYNFTNLIDNNSKDLFTRNYRIIFTDEDLSEIYNNHLNDIYEKAKTN